MPGESSRQQYERWVREQTDGLYRLALRLSGRTHVAEELVQETFYHAWRSMDSLRDMANARGWLFRILRNRYAHWLRDRSRRLIATASDDMDNLTADTKTPDEAIEREDFLQQALGHLEDRYKVPLLMVYLDGMTCREAAAELDIPIGTVLSRIHRARQSVRERVEASQRRDDQSRIRLVSGNDGPVPPSPSQSPAGHRETGSARQLGGGS